MTSSLKAFLTGLIDYAGLFPPAGLGMTDAAARFAHHLGSDFGWMVGPFICPSERLPELAAQREILLENVPEGLHVSVSVIGTPVLTTGVRRIGDLDEASAADASRIRHFEDEGWARCLQLEVKWVAPEKVDEGIADLLRYAEAFSSRGCRIERFYFEIDRDASFRDNVGQMVSAISGAGSSFGFKIRTGGLSPNLYPATTEVAMAIKACRDAGVPFKATAGLHHPVRHRRSDGAVTEHGFLNVFAAAVFADALRLDEEGLIEILNEEDLDQFEFGTEHLRWRSYEVPIQAIELARARLAASFGSCSVDEPLEDLHDAGLLSFARDD